jgi:SAM-dependent methyltransferase
MRVLPGGIVLVDLGCGTGGLLRALDGTYPVRRGFDRPTDITERVPIASDYADAVTLLAVLEHLSVEGGMRALREAYRILRRGGTLVVTTPSWGTDPLLRAMARCRLLDRRQIDEHQTYYTLGALRRTLELAGFENVAGGRFELGLNLWASGRRP